MQIQVDWKDSSEACCDPAAEVTPVMTAAGVAGKRAVDFLLAFAGVLFLLPLLGLIALLIKLDSPGPVFFRQKRAGRDGKLFEIFKFRTMVDGAYLMGSRLTVKRDPRITRLGRLLRWSKLDELPQLFNVLIGDMSLIGPRPEDPYFVQFYSARQRAALSVRPGIVGPSQIVGRDETEEYPEGLRDTERYYLDHILPPKLERDLAYVQNATFWGDIHILLHGMWVTVRGALRAKYIWRRRRSLGLMVMDVVVALASYALALVLLLNPSTDVSRYVWHTVAWIAIIRPPLFAYFGCYHLIPSYFGLWDLVALFKAV
ncbi:MAG TPA: sugar transferase, partial [Terriglobales bacterium]|nr:sugar transferase [Terriglobales bacterium]